MYAGSNRGCLNPKCAPILDLHVHNQMRVALISTNMRRRDSSSWNNNNMRDSLIQTWGLMIRPGLLYIQWGTPSSMNDSLRTPSFITDSLIHVDTPTCTSAICNPTMMVAHGRLNYPPPPKTTYISSACTQAPTTTYTYHLHAHKHTSTHTYLWHCFSSKPHISVFVVMISAL